MAEVSLVDKLTDGGIEVVKVVIYAVVILAILGGTVVTIVGLI